MLKALIRANKMLGSTKPKAKIKAQDLAKEWGKIYDKGADVFLKYTTKDKSAEKSISNKATEAFDDAVYRNNIRGFKAKSLKMTGGEYFSSSNDAVLYELTGYADLEFTTPKELSKEEVIEALEEMQSDFQNYMDDDQHLVLEGYTPLTRSETATAIAYMQGLKEVPTDENEIDEMFEEVYEETRISGVYGENGGGLDKILTGGNGKWTLELWIFADYVLDF